MLRTFARWLLCGTLGALPLAACGSVAEAPSDACAEAAAIYCSRFEECSAFWFAVIWDSQVACQAEEKSRCREELDAGGSGLTREHVLACAEATGASCELMVTTAADQGPLPVGFLSFRPEACRAPSGGLPLGAACGFDSQCSSRLCAYESGCMRCVDGLPAGAACADPFGNARCAADLICFEECRPSLYEGDACGGFNQECEGPLACVDGSCALEHLGGAAGDPCPTVNHCEPLLGLLCGASGGSGGPVCTQWSLAGAGESCGASVACRAGLACTSAGVCEPKAGGCITSADCAEGSCSARTCAGAPVPSSCLSPRRN